ncbi:MAG: hypothetical protein ACJ04O_01315 [Cellvibrionales bacterium]
MALTALPAAAHGPNDGGIQAAKTADSNPDFDIIHAKVSRQDNVATFHMGVAGEVGNTLPTPAGKLAGAPAYAYVWPTSIDSYEAGFERNAGILALAVATHPDFDDTPLFDENGDKDTGNDGGTWHTHWVVLKPDERCGEGALTVVDIPKNTTPRLPKTWPGLPILLDSPGWEPVIESDTVEVKVAFDNAAVLDTASYDGVTAGLMVNKNIHAPLFCVSSVLDVASGDLSLPGKITPPKAMKSQ